MLTYSSLPREPGCDDDRDDDANEWQAVAAPSPVAPRYSPRPPAPTATVRGHVTTIPDDYGHGVGPVQVAVVNAQSVSTGCPAPGYDRPFRVTAWELRIACHGASLATRSRDCWRLARTTGVSPPRWLGRAVGELFARRVTSADVACQIAAWHREHSHARQPGDSPVPWRDREQVDCDDDVITLTLTPSMRAATPAAAK